MLGSICNETLIQKGNYSGKVLKAYLMATHFWTLLDRAVYIGLLLMLRLTHCCIYNWEQHKCLKLFFNETDSRTSIIMLYLCAELELMGHNILKLSRSSFRPPPHCSWILIFCKVKQHMFIVIYQHLDHSSSLLELLDFWGCEWWIVLRWQKTTYSICCEIFLKSEGLKLPTRSL
jgi:hypothetical protein